MIPHTLKVLVADDEKSVRDFFGKFLQLLAVDATIVENGQQALALAQKEDFDLAFLDIRMPGLNGLQTFAELAKVNRGLSCVFMTGYAEEKALIEEANQPGTVVLTKPFENLDCLREIVDRIRQQRVTSSDRIARDPSEKRVFRRNGIECAVSCHATAGDHFVDVLAVNISVDGMMLSAREDLACGTTLNLVMTSGGSRCAATAKVVWCQKDQGDASCHLTGVRFMEVDYGWLAGLLKRLKSDRPGR